MRKICLAFLLLSLFACKKEATTLETPPINSILTQVENFQTIKDLANLSKQDNIRLLKFLDTCSKESLTRVRNKFRTLSTTKFHGPVSTNRTSATTLDEPPPDMAAVQDIEDEFDYVEEYTPNRMRYWWKALKSADNSYWVKSLEDVYFWRVEGVTDWSLRYKILALAHSGSYMAEKPGTNYQWGETNYHNEFVEYWARFDLTGVIVNHNTGYSWSYTNFRYVNFGTFIGSGGIQYL